MVRQYETPFIVDAQLPGEEIEAEVVKYAQLIEKHGGKIKLLDRWGKRRLAYEIAKKQYGYYVYIRFEAEGTIVEVLEKEFRIDDSILRYLVLKLPKALIKAETQALLKPAAEVHAEEDGEKLDAGEPVEP